MCAVTFSRFVLSFVSHTCQNNNTGAMVMSSCVLSNSQEAGVRESLGSWEIWQALILCRGRRGIMKERRGEVREVGGGTRFLFMSVG